MSYRDHAAVRERLEQLEIALGAAAKPRRPARWLRGIVVGLVVAAVASVVAVWWLVG